MPASQITNVGAAGQVTPASDASPGAVWVLLGKHHGDNLQLLALAETLDRPVITFNLRYRKHLSRLPGTLLGRTCLPLAEPIVWPKPWPCTVLAAGRRVVPVARWIQGEAARNGIRTRLIHLGRPRAPLQWFDLVVTTAQYGLPDRDNVIGNLLPLRIAPRREEEAGASPLARLEGLPRPWTVVLVGGNSRPYYFDRDGAHRLAHTVEQQTRTHGGSAIVLGAPRTSPECLDVIEQELGVPHVMYRWHAGDNPYQALLRVADRFVVTGDSLAMLGDALASGKPVELFGLPKRLDRRARIALFCKSVAMRSPLLRAVHAWLIDAGMIFSLRDLGDCHRRLRDAGVFDRPWLARALAARERRRTIAHVQALVTDAATGRADQRETRSANTGSNIPANLRAAYRLK